MKALFLCVLGCLLSANVSAEGRLLLQPRQWLLEDGDGGEGFSLRFRFKAAVADTRLLEVPGVLRVDVVDGRSLGDDHGQNYLACPMADGSVPALEATLTLRLPGDEDRTDEMRVGVPLAALANPWGEHEAVINYSGARYTLYVDNMLADNDFPFGQPAAEMDEGRLLTNNTCVGEVSMAHHALTVKADPKAEAESVPVQYFTPRGHNAWVGDVATCYYHGRYHLFYLYDRRGHRSKLGRGGHYFEHLSTADFRTWKEHPAATPIEEQWETIGTGTPFVWHDSLFVSYGYHTSRLFPTEKTSTPMQWDYIRSKGESMMVPFGSLENGVFPSGATYSTAMDEEGNHFAKSGRLIHPAENPTIYEEDGRLMMLANYGARGTWTSDRPDGGWRCLSEDFPPGGDCTFIFSWGRYDYIVGGFTHQWMKRHDQSIAAYRDMVAEGQDMYDGLSVPAITALPDGRRIMAGWMELNRHWGGPLVLRELVQMKDGTIGSRWLKEVVPEVRSRRLLSGAVTTQTEFEALPDSAFMLTFDLSATGGKTDGRGLRLLLMPDGGDDDACEWSISLDEGRAQFAHATLAAPGQRQKTLREGGEPHRAVDYAIEHLPIPAKGTIPVRLIAQWSPKFGGTVVDVEIAGKRTMICYRHGLRPSRMLVTPVGTRVENPVIATI